MTARAHRRRPGWKTSEFFLALVAMGCITTLAALGKDSVDVTAAVAGLGGYYGSTRLRLKREDDEQPAAQSSQAIDFAAEPATT
jgi:hypothetical protein